MDLQLEGKAAIVTGGSRGIGKATTELLTARGARVMAIARSEAELAALGVEYTVADLGTLEGCTLAVEETAGRLGPVEIFVCNHGIGSAHEKVIWEQDPDVWYESMRINLDGPFHMSRLLMPGMVLCIEPAHYEPDIEGYHLEDLVQVTEDGVEVLTDYESAREPPVIS